MAQAKRGALTGPRAPAGGEPEADFVAGLEAEARLRFVRWDAALWKEVVAGPARELAESLERARAGPEHGEAVLTSYLRLAREGIGLGYLFPAAAAGGENFFTLAWAKLIPRSLAALPPSAQAETLAVCWNLAENLESSPVWLRRIFLRVCASRDSLADLPSLVADVSRRALEEPGRTLGERSGLRWLYLADEDRRFLPGAVHFVAPTVACVHDRHRTAAGGRDAVTMGAWVTDPPLLLGPMGCKESPSDPGLRIELLEDVSRRDPRAADWFAMAANAWRAAVTLTTSQFLVALLPE